MKILGIETTCDETSAAVVENGRYVLSCEIATQISEHSLYGGVVPEIASRMHTESIVEVVDSAIKKSEISLSDIDAVAVSAAPGLIGAVLVGLSFAKGISISLNKPFIPVHHIRGHIASCYISNPELEPPFLCLIASGGHSLIVNVKNYTDLEILGRGIDDAAGEALDKVARVMGLGYPGGAVLDKLSEGELIDDGTLPYPNTKNPLDFSFSGLKTAAVNLVHNAKQRSYEIDKKHLATVFCTKIATILLDKAELALRQLSYKKLAIVGGVAANSQLRKLAETRLTKNNIEVYTPKMLYCGDNAAMIAAAGYYEFLDGNVGGMGIAGAACMSVEEKFIL